MHRIYPIDSDGERVANTDQAAGYEAVLDGPASLFSKSQKYGIRMANFLPACPSVTAGRWLVRSSSTRRPARPDSFALDPTEDLDSHYSAGDQFDSDVERTLADKWERANTDWKLVREDDVFDPRC